MTLSQLRAFALVARLGSMRAAAAELAVSEPAVSMAIAALRQDLADPLVVRSGGGIALTAGGRRLAAYADEIVGLADRARREVASAGTSQDVLRVAATPAFAEHAAAALVDAFTRRSPGLQVELARVAPARLKAALVDRSADIVLGLRAAGVGDLAVEAVPFLRYQRVVVVSHRHRLAGRAGGAPMPRAALRGEPWLTGPAEHQERSEEGRWLSAPTPDLVRLPSEGDALLAVREGRGVMLALRHVVRPDLRRGTLLCLPVAGTPVQGLWCASTLGQGKATAGARALQRFATTPDATAAMVATGPARRLAPVHVNLWS